MNLSFGESAICHHVARLSEARRSRNSQLFDETFRSLKETMLHVKTAEPKLYETYSHVLAQRFDH